MIASLLAAAALAAAAPPAAPIPMRQVTMPAADMDFLGRFLDHYAGQGCEIHTQGGVDACQAAVQAMTVWRELQTATPVEPRKATK